MILRLHGVHFLRGIFCFFEFGVGHREATAKEGGFPKGNIVYAQPERFLHKLERTKPNQFYDTCAIGEKGLDALVRTSGYFVDVDDLTFELYKRHILLQVGYAMNGGAVDVFVGKGVEKVAERGHAQLCAQNFCAHWAYTF